MNRKLMASTVAGVLGLCGYGLYSTAAARTHPVRASDLSSRCVVWPEATNVSLEILVEGSPTPVYHDAGYHWIEGRRGQRFAFHITNHNPFPVGVIPSADGHSLTADGRAGANQPAYVIAPYSSETIGLWREDLHGGRELMFTGVDRSLAALKGDRRNIGVLGVLVWQLEDRARREPPRPLDRYGRAPAAGAKSRAGSAFGGRDEEGIGVGVGDRVSDRAYFTDRYRRVRVLGTESIYYDDRQGLLRAGVDLYQYPEYEPPYYRDDPHRDRREADPFPEGGYRGVRIPD